MTTVFLSGSRNISRLNDTVRTRIKDMLDRSIDMVVGDANGADKALQQFLADENYRNVAVFCAGTSCRNNIGGWDVHEVSVDPTLNGRAFYTVKDKEMASRADYGFVIWDGKSVGSINNVHELLKKGKRAVVYLSPQKRFVDVADQADIDALIGSSEPDVTARADRRRDTNRQITEAGSGRQGVLDL